MRRIWVFKFFKRVIRVRFYAKKVGKPLYLRTSLKMVGGAGFEPTKSKTTDLQSGSDP